MSLCDRSECDPKCEGNVRDIVDPSRPSNAQHIMVWGLWREDVRLKSFYKVKIHQCNSQNKSLLFGEFSISLYFCIRLLNRDQYDEENCLCLVAVSVLFRGRIKDMLRGLMQKAIPITSKSRITGIFLKRKPSMTIKNWQRKWRQAARTTMRESRLSMAGFAVIYNMTRRTRYVRQTVFSRISVPLSVLVWLQSYSNSLNHPNVLLFI